MVSWITFKVRFVLKIFPVIHLLDSSTAQRQALVARRCGADGIFIISHHGDNGTVVQVARDIKLGSFALPVGINLLGEPADYVFRVAVDNKLNMIWADDMGVDSTGLSPIGEALSTVKTKGNHLDMFASVAFKYRPFEVDPAEAALNALNAGFIPTTSGDGTGIAPDVAKIKLMSEATGGRLAIASGMRPDNVALFAPYLSHILVATGVALDDYRIDEGKLSELIRIAKKS